MVEDNVKDKLNYMFWIIRMLLHEGIRYFNYTLSLVSAICVLNIISIEETHNLSILNTPSLKAQVNVCMVLVDIFVVLYFITKYAMGFNRTTAIRKIIHYILYHLLTFFLMYLMEIKTITVYIFSLIPIGVIVVILLKAMILLFDGKIDSKQ